MVKIILVRHGQSKWNKLNRFTGWVDIGLSKQGIDEAKQAGKLIAQSGIIFHSLYTSWLKRAIKTLWYIQEEANLCHLCVQTDWRLNERHYGKLTGLNKTDVRKKYGDEQVKIWRRSYDISPPKCDEDDKYHPKNLTNYADLYQTHNIMGESLSETIERIQPLLKHAIMKDVQQGKNIIISAHGNTIRALIKYFFVLNAKEIMSIEVPTANPLLIDFSDKKVISAGYLDSERKSALPEL